MSPFDATALTLVGFGVVVLIVHALLYPRLDYYSTQTRGSITTPPVVTAMILIFAGLVVGLLGKFIAS